MASGVVPVTTAVGGALDLINHGTNGLLVPLDDMATLERAIISVLTVGTHQQSLAAAARRTVITSYSLDVTVERLINIYESLAKSRRCPD
jgi:glycosyltransferase involved in cell wall biosynthesis